MGPGIAIAMITRHGKNVKMAGRGAWKHSEEYTFSEQHFEIVDTGPRTMVQGEGDGPNGLKLKEEESRTCKIRSTWLSSYVKWKLNHRTDETDLNSPPVGPFSATIRLAGKEECQC